MATEYKLSYTASEINRKLATVDETKSALENNYYTSTEIDTKIEEVNASFEEVNSFAEETISSIDEINTSLENKADLVDGKIPTEQLPDDIGGGLTEVAWDDIENKPFGETGFQIEWDGTPTLESAVTPDALGYYKVGDSLPKSEIIGATLKAINDGTNTEQILSDSDIVDYNENCYGMANMPFFIVTTQSTEFDFMGMMTLSFTSAGVWFIMSPDGSTRASYLGKGEIKKIDKKYLPDDIGGGLTEVSWNDLTDKPFGEFGFQYDSILDITGESFGEGAVVKVGNPLTKEELTNATINMYNEGIGSATTPMPITTDMFSDFNEHAFAVLLFGETPAVVVSTQAATITTGEETAEIPSAGLWLLAPLVKSIEKDYSFKKIDKKYLPDDIGGGLTEVSWNDLEDKPFGEEGFKVEWDGSTPTDTFVEVMDGMGFYKASDSTPTKEELIGAIYIGGDGEGRPTEFILTESDIADYNADCYGLEVTPCFLITTQATEVEMFGMTLPFPSAGAWFITFGLPMSLSKGELKQLDPKFIPNYFGEVGTKIEWDGTPTSVYETFDMGGTTGYFYKVSEPVDTIIDGICTIQADGGMEIPLSPDTVQVTDGGENGIYTVNVKVPNSTFDFSNAFGGTVTFREIGLYFFYANMGGEEGKTTSFTSSDYGIKQIDKKFIPDDIVASVSLTFDEVPTEGSQNPVKSMGIHSAISALEGKITSTFCYKGTVDNYSDLPSSDNTVGDVWNIANADEANGVNAGDNAAWNGTSWDILAGVIDLSDYYTKTEIDSMALNGNINLTNYYTKAETDSLIANAGTGGGNVDLSDYYTKSETDSSLALKADLIDGKVPLEQLPENIGSGGSIVDCPTYSGGSFMSTDPIMIFNYHKVMNTITADSQINWNAGVYDIDTNEFLFTFKSAGNITSNDNIVINIATGFNGTTYNDYTSDLSVELLDTKELKKNSWYTAYCVYNETQGKMVGYLISASADVDTSAIQTKANLVTSINENSTDEQYPSAKLLYDLIGDCDAVLDEISALIGE